MRFLVYGPRSGEVTPSNEWMDRKLEELRREYVDKEPTRPKEYVGYRLQPDVFEFYQLNADRISDSFIVRRQNTEWDVVRVVP